MDSLDFKRVEDLYIKRYASRAKKVKLGEHSVPLPVAPPDNQCENYGLPKEEQVFKRNKVPIDLRTWDARDEEAYVAAEYHKRDNGIWMFIGGKKTYIPGTAYVFFNYWYMENGMLPTYRVEALEFFLFWEFCLSDPQCFGMYVLKPRRIGDTEKVLCIIWCMVTRMKHSYGGMQNYNGEQSSINFKRLVQANNKMIYFFKPVNRGTDNPERVLSFRYPEDRLSLRKQRDKKKRDEKMLIADDFRPKGLESKVDWMPTIIRAYDGSRLTIYYMDEQGKIKPSDMDSVEQWSIVSKTLTLYNDELIIGKGVIATTVEDIDDGKTVEKARHFWTNSDPTDRNENNRTTTGLYRLFRDYTKAARVDKFGNHNAEAARKMRAKTIKDYEKKGLIDKITELKRKQPATVEEALATPATDCILLPFTLDKRMHQIDNWLDPNDQKIPTNQRVPLGYFGNLVWQSGRREGVVRWVADPDGKWFISQHPDFPNNKTIEDRIILPGNSSVFSLGVDPIDSTIGTGSKFAMVVRRKLDLRVEKALKFDENTGEILNPEQMITDQIVCDYVHRPDSPEEIIDDFLKTAIYFGVPGLIEMQKGGYLRNVLNEMGYSGYVQLRPMETYTNPFSKRSTSEQGASASTAIIQLYVDALKYQIATRWKSHRHRRVLADNREFNKDNRTKCDLTVADGYSLLGAMDGRLKAGIEKDREEWITAPWSEYEEEYV